MKNIQIDTLLLGRGTRYDLSKLSGFSKPPIRTSGDDYAGKDGGYVSAQNYSVRVMEIDGEVNGLSCQDAEDLRQALEALPIREVLPVFLTTFAGNLYFTEVVIYDIKAEIEGGTFGAYRLTIAAPDPYFYLADTNDPDSVYIEQVFYKITGGGYVTPYILPVIWEPGNTPASISNGGAIRIYPEIILEGQYTNPVITNETTGQVFALDITTTAGDEIVIDMKNRTVTLNGGSITAYVTDESNWIWLNVGANNLLLNSDSSSDTDFGTVRYRAGIEGL